MKKFIRTCISPSIDWESLKARAKREANNTTKITLVVDDLTIAYIRSEIYRNIDVVMNSVQRFLFSDESNYNKKFIFELEWRTQLRDTDILIHVYEDIEET